MANADQHKSRAKGKEVEHAARSSETPQEEFRAKGKEVEHAPGGSDMPQDKFRAKGKEVEPAAGGSEMPQDPMKKISGSAPRKKMGRHWSQLMWAIIAQKSLRLAHEEDHKPSVDDRLDDPGTLALIVRLAAADQDMDATFRERRSFFDVEEPSLVLTPSTPT